MTVLRWRRVFPGEERQVSVMRSWLTSLLPDCPAREDVALVATEISSNAVLHTASGQGGWFAMEITWHPLAVRVAVADGGAPAGPRLVDDPAGEHGRGMRVVHAFSARSGVCGDDRGRLVWAEVPWDHAAVAEDADQYEVAIRDGQDCLASHFAGIPTWFGRSTLLWWALAGGELVAAPSAEELATLLGRPLAPPGAGCPGSGDAAGACPGAVSVSGRDPQRGFPAPQSGGGHGLLSGSEQLITPVGGHSGPRIPPVPPASRQEASAGAAGLARTG
jgi:anti-sigma regulatory factor (Ser/Thr protein kinase)